MGLNYKQKYFIQIAGYRLNPGFLTIPEGSGCINKEGNKWKVKDVIPRLQYHKLVIFHQ